MMMAPLCLSLCVFYFFGNSPTHADCDCAPPRLPPPLFRKSVKCGGLCICRQRRHTYICRWRTPARSFPPHPRTLARLTAGAASPRARTALPSAKQTLLVSQWVRERSKGVHSTACHAVDPNYSPFTSPSFLSRSFVLPAAPLCPPETYLQRACQWRGFW